MDTIRQRSVLQAVLLEVLGEHPAGMLIEQVYETIDQNYRFPEEWYRQIPSAAAGYQEVERHGYTDWRKVPQAQLIELVPTEPQWQNEIRRARNDLRKLGYLDTTTPRGKWRLSEAGMAAVANVTREGLSSEEQRILNTRQRSAQPISPATPPPTIEAGPGLRAGLLSKLELLTHSMPLEDLQFLVEVARLIRLRSLPDNASAGDTTH